MRLDLQVWNQLEEIRKNEGFPTMNKLVNFIIQEFIQYGSFSKSETPAIREIKDLLENQQRFFDEKLDDLLKDTAEAIPPENFEIRSSRIIALLKSTPMGLENIAKITGMSETDVFMILGNLYDGGKIAYNDKWEYYVI